MLDSTKFEEFILSSDAEKLNTCYDYLEPWSVLYNICCLNTCVIIDMLYIYAKKFTHGRCYERSLIYMLPWVQMLS